jgi:hypothetical protein
MKCRGMGFTSVCLDFQVGKVGVFPFRRREIVILNLNSSVKLLYMNFLESSSFIHFPFPFHPNLNNLNPEITLSNNITKGHLIINGH